MCVCVEGRWGVEGRRGWEGERCTCVAAGQGGDGPNASCGDAEARVRQGAACVNSHEAGGPGREARQKPPRLLGAFRYVTPPCTQTPLLLEVTAAAAAAAATAARGWRRSKQGGSPGERLDVSLQPGL